MIDTEKKTCKCEIKGKQFDENDETCIKCRNSEKVLEMLFEAAVEEAIKKGDISLLKAFFKLR